MPERMLGYVAALYGRMRRKRAPRGGIVPSTEYQLVDVWRQDRRKLAAMRNVVAAVFRLEIAQTLKEVGSAVRDINRWFSGSKFDSLRQTVLDYWIKDYWYPERLGRKIIRRVVDLLEMERYMRNKPKTFLQRAKEQGVRQGRPAGLEEGRRTRLKKVDGLDCKPVVSKGDGPAKSRFCCVNWNANSA